MAKRGAILLSLVGLTALGIAVPRSALAAQMPDLCKQGSDLDPGFQQPEEPCGGQSTCMSTTRQLKQWETEYRGLIQQACGNGKNFKPATGTDQKQALQQNLSILQQAKSSIDAIIKKNVELLNQSIPRQAGKNVQAMKTKLQEEVTRARDFEAQSRISDARQTLQKSENLFRPQNGGSFRNEQISEGDVEKVKSTDPKAQAKALHHSSVFARKLLIDADHRRRTAAELDSMISQTQAALNKTGEAESGEKKDEKSGGLDAKDAAGLAGAAAPLAQAAQKKDGAESGITGNTNSDPYSASNYASNYKNNEGTSASTGNSAEKSNANPKNAVSLHSSNSPSSSGKGGSDPLGLASSVSSNSATPFTGSYGSRAGSGAESSYSSDRANRGDASGLIGVSSGKILGGGGAKPGDVFGAGQREPASTTETKPGAEDALESFSGGGGLNYGNSHASSTAPPAEDPMKEMLEDMGEVVDSYDESYDPEMQADGVGAAEGEDLFRRISACYVRSVKGGLLN